MARFSFVNLESVHQLQRQIPGSPANVLAQLAPGEVVRGQVVRDLGSGLFALSIRGAEVVASSTSPLTSGQFLTLQVSTNSEGQPALHVVTAADGTIASVTGQAEATELDNGTQPDVVSLRIARDLGATKASRTPARTSVAPNAAAPEVSPSNADGVTRTAELLRPDGPVARLLAQRPDLAPRIEELLGRTLQRSEGLGAGIERLAGQVRQVLDSSPSELRPTLTADRSNLIGRILTPEALDQPESLARALADFLGRSARGLEGSIARLAEQAPTSQATGAGPAHLATANSAATESASVAAESMATRPGAIESTGRETTATDRLAGELRAFLGANARPLSETGKLELAQQFNQLVGARTQSLSTTGVGELSQQLRTLATSESDPVLASRLTRLADGLARIADQRPPLAETQTPRPTSPATAPPPGAPRATPTADQVPGVSRPPVESIPARSAEPVPVTAESTAGGLGRPLPAGLSAPTAPLAAGTTVTDPQATLPASTAAQQALANQGVAHEASARQAGRAAAGASETSLSARPDPGAAGPAERSVPPAEVVVTREIVQASFDGDLKGQLLQLRSHLEALSTRAPEAARSVGQAIEQANVLIDQVTAQQVRNVDGLNQFLYAELPMDPGSGIDEARLHVFYRRPSATPAGDDPDRFTVALFLDLTKLGEVLAVVTALEGGVNVAFTVESPAVERLLSEDSDSLRAALVAAGQTGATVTVRQAPAPQAERAVELDDIWNAFVETLPTEDDPGIRLDTEA